MMYRTESHLAQQFEPFSTQPTKPHATIAGCGDSLLSNTERSNNSRKYSIPYTCQHQSTPKYQRNLDQPGLRKQRSSMTQHMQTPFHSSLTHFECQDCTQEKHKKSIPKTAFQKAIKMTQYLMSEIERLQHGS